MASNKKRGGFFRWLGNPFKILRIYKDMRHSFFPTGGIQEKLMLILPPVTAGFYAMLTASTLLTYLYLSGTPLLQGADVWETSKTIGFVAMFLGTVSLVLAFFYNLLVVHSIAKWYKMQMSWNFIGANAFVALLILLLCNGFLTVRQESLFIHISWTLMIGVIIGICVRIYMATEQLYCRNAAGQIIQYGSEDHRAIEKKRLETKQMFDPTLRKKRWGKGFKPVKAANDEKQ